MPPLHSQDGAPAVGLAHSSMPVGEMHDAASVQEEPPAGKWQHTLPGETQSLTSSQA